MISKERFNKLKEKDGKLYYISGNYIIDADVKSKDPEIELNLIDWLGGISLAVCLKENGAILHILCDISNVFETEEDAEWHLEFGNITRKETLKLPTWEEFNKDNFGIKFYNKSREFCLHRVRYSSSDKNPLWKIDLYESYGDDEDTVAWEKSWDLTKENYIEACLIAKKLFLGEEV